MRTLLLTTLNLLFLCSIQAQEVTNYAMNSILVKLKAEHNDQSLTTAEKFQAPTLQRLHAQYSVEHIEQIGNRRTQNTFVIRFSAKQPIQEVIQQYKATNRFEYVEPNYTGSAGGECFEMVSQIPNDALFSRQWGLSNDGNFPLSDSEEGVDIMMEEAWDIEQGDANIIIAVLDSGVKIDHPELAGRLWTNPNEVLDGTDTDGNGYIDDIDGWNFAYNTNDPSDDVGHGTNIIGLLGSIPNNATAYAGINWNSKIMNLKMLNDQNAYTDVAWAVDAIYYAVDNGADIINMSWGSTGDSSALQDAVTYAHSNGVVLTAAMLNFDNNIPIYPAAYTETIAVGSIDPDGDRSSPFYWDVNSGSNFGPHIDLIAPGNYTYSITHTSNNNYNIYWGGTSQAAPHVAGIASLLLSQDGSLTPEEIRTIMNSTADDETGDPSEDTPGWDQYYGFGRLNAFQALSSILNVSENNYETAISIYPNPVDGTERLSFSSNAAPITAVKLYTILGTVAFEQSVPNRTDYEMEVANFAAGVYIVEVHTLGNKQVERQKIVIAN
ncbi:S8 family serine peptidase [Candidatus Ulvibacter alkanivorans]|uniref:S8 family serine peptidase n=1 Tax=Candidatus Ulvibacter alkanivorans TaxID=2267620 RepID=UPI000DF21BAD|nr:S8 family serine peptidase [Candidatus Ulvibacter alkanivorans]